MRKLECVLVLGLAVMAASTSAFGQLPTTKVLTVDVAEIIAQGAMAKCRADGYKVTVLVVDGLNSPKAMLRDDGADCGNGRSREDESDRDHVVQPSVRACDAPASRPGRATGDHPRNDQCARGCADQGR